MYTTEPLPTIGDLQARLKLLESEVASLRDAQPAETSKEAKVTLVVYSGSLDRLLAAMNIAVGAASMGREVHLFFTFWATAALRKGPMKGKRPLIERMFGFMLPSGMKKVSLSTMHMGGMGTAMIKNRMKQKEFAGLEELFAMARDLGIKLAVCEMSMDLMGLNTDDLIDYPDVEQCGVSTFMSNALDSSVTLFI